MSHMIITPFRRLQMTSCGALAAIGMASSFGTLAQAQPIRVLTLDGARSGICDGIARDLGASPRLSTVRGDLLDPAFFGPSGVIARPIQLSTVHQITPTSLGGADILVLTSVVPLVPGGTLLEASEVALVGEFVRQGGGLFVFWNNGAEQLGSLFGASSGGFLGSGIDAPITSAAPVNGPFGSASGFFVQTYRGWFQTLGTGTPFLSQNVGATFQLGAGHAVIVNDEEWAWNVGGNPCGSPELTAAGRVLFRNCVAMAIPGSPCFSFLTITEQPGSAAVCSSSATAVSVTAEGAGPFTYQWQAEDASVAGGWRNLVDGAVVIGGALWGTVADTGTSVLRATALPHAIDAGSALRVRVVVSNTCGSVTSEPATLTICAADFNCSGSPSVQDIFDFLAAYFGSDPRADFNGSGAIGVQDIFDFLAAYFAGCP